MYTVYCHTFPNQKRYVGLTKGALNRRWGNGTGYKTCPLVARAIEKYGWENVKHEILAIADTLQEAEELERKYIQFYSTNDPKYGYNILPGGDVSMNEPTDDIRRKMGQGWRGKHRTEEEKAKISEGVRKAFARPESNGHYGMRASDTTKEKMSATHKARWAEPRAKEQQREKLLEIWQRDEYKSHMQEVRKKQRHRTVGEYHVSDETKAKISNHNKGKWIGDKSPCSKAVLQ